MNVMSYSNLQHRYLGQVCNAKRRSKSVGRQQKIQAFLTVSALPTCLASYNCICIHIPGGNLSVKEYQPEPVLYMAAVRGLSNESYQILYIKLYPAHS